MRKITSKRTEEKKRKRNQFLVGGILIFIMLFSIIGYSFKGTVDEEEKVNYNGIEFVKENGLWTTNIEGFQFSFKYNPNEVEQINSQLNLLSSYYNKPLYIYSENSEAVEIYRNLFYNNQIVQRIQYACLEEECENEDLPIKTCEDNFIIIKEGEEDIITQNENCVFIEGKELDKLSDSFLFKIIKITQ